MIRISSESATFWHKRAFPFLWFCLMAVSSSAFLSRADNREDLLMLVFVLALVVVGVFSTRRQNRALADSVDDAGSYLVVNHRGVEDRVALSNVMHVQFEGRRITMKLVKPVQFGAEFAFFPLLPFSYGLVAKCPIADDLIVRVDRARADRA